MSINRKIKQAVVVSALTLAASVSALSYAGHSDACYPRNHNPEKKPIHANKYNADFYKVQLTAPQDPAFREMMGGEPTNMSMASLMAGEGTMFITAFKNGRTDITFDFSYLLPNAVYSLWNVIDPNYQTGEFVDAPLPDQTNRPLPVKPGRLGAPEEYGRHAFITNKCGAANFKITMYERPGKEFLLDYHANDFETTGGIKGYNVFPGALWGKFPEWD